MSYLVWMLCIVWVSYVLFIDRLWQLLLLWGPFLCLSVQIVYIALQQYLISLNKNLGSCVYPALLHTAEAAMSTVQKLDLLLDLQLKLSFTDRRVYG